MNRYLFFSLNMLLLLLTGTLSAQELRTVPAANGIWIISDRSVLSGSALQRREAGKDWQDVGHFAAPKNAGQFLVAYHEAALLAPPAELLTDEQLTMIWQHFVANRVIDSLGFYREYFTVSAAAGAAFFDATASSGARYEYRAAIAQGFTTTTAAVSFPPKMDSSAIVRPHLIQPTREGVYLEFEIEQAGNMQSAHIYRNYYLRSNAERIKPQLIYTKRDGKVYACFTDLTATPRVPYNYTFVPVDAAGNEGKASDPVRLFHVPKSSIPPSVRHLAARSDEARRSIHISWLPPVSSDIVSVEVYRGNSYSGAFQRIASLSPKDTSFDDFEVEPITTYYYTVALNGTYEQSVNTPRVPGILKSTDANLSAPINLQAKLKGNTVVLTWDTTAEPCRGFFVYRADGYKGELKRISALVYNNGVFEYRDTLNPGVGTRVFSYAVSDENSSYFESPLSARAAIQVELNPAATLPVIDDIAVVPAEDGSGVQVMWHDLRVAPSDAYVLYRTELDESGNAVGKEAVIQTAQAYYFDKAVLAGRTYAYSAAISSGSMIGSRSNVHRYRSPLERPLPPSDISASDQDGFVALRWTVPMGMSLRKVYILRSLPNGSPEQIAALDPGQSEYNDKQVKKGERYYYSLLTESDTGVMSEATLPMSIRVRP